MSRRIGWRLRRKNRTAPRYKQLLIRTTDKKIENRVLEQRRVAAEAYIKYLSYL